MKAITHQKLIQRMSTLLFLKPRAGKAHSKALVSIIF